MEKRVALGTYDPATEPAVMEAAASLGWQVERDDSAMLTAVRDFPSPLTGGAGAGEAADREVASLTQAVARIHRAVEDDRAAELRRTLARQVTSGEALSWVNTLTAGQVGILPSGMLPSGRAVAAAQQQIGGPEPAAGDGGNDGNGQADRLPAASRLAELQPVMWATLDAPGKAQVATTYFAQDLAAHAKDTAARSWALSSEVQLMEARDRALDVAEQAAADHRRARAELEAAGQEEDERLASAREAVESARSRSRRAEETAELYEQALRRRLGLPTAAETKLHEERVKIVGEMLNVIMTWRRLARVGVILLVLVLVFAAWVIYSLQVKVSALSGLEFTGILVALAVFVISPAVLLLLERPLKGLDEYPGGGSGEEKKEEKPAEKAEEKDTEKAKKEKE